MNRYIFLILPLSIIIIWASTVQASGLQQCSIPNIVHLPNENGPIYAIDFNADSVIHKYIGWRPKYSPVHFGFITSDSAPANQPEYYACNGVNCTNQSEFEAFIGQRDLGVLQPNERISFVSIDIGAQPYQYIRADGKIVHTISASDGVVQTIIYTNTTNMPQNIVYDANQESTAIVSKCIQTVAQTPTPTITLTPTHTATQTVNPTPIPTETPFPTMTLVPTHTSTHTTTPTSTTVQLPSKTPTSTPETIFTPTSTNTPFYTETPYQGPGITVTQSPTVLPMKTSTPTPTNTMSVTSIPPSIITPTVLPPVIETTPTP